MVTITCYHGNHYNLILSFDSRKGVQWKDEGDDESMLGREIEEEDGSRDGLEDEETVSRDGLEDDETEHTSDQRMSAPVIIRSVTTNLIIRSVYNGLGKYLPETHSHYFKTI